MDFKLYKIEKEDNFHNFIFFSLSYLDSSPSSIHNGWIPSLYSHGKECPDFQALPKDCLQWEMSEADRSGPVGTYLSIGVQPDSRASFNLPADQILPPHGAMPSDLVRAVWWLQQISSQGWGQLQRLAMHGCLRFNPGDPPSFSSPTYAAVWRFWPVACHYP